MTLCYTNMFLSSFAIHQTQHMGQFAEHRFIQVLPILAKPGLLTSRTDTQFYFELSLTRVWDLRPIV